MSSAPVPVLYEDADLVAVDKPAGMVVIPGRDAARETALRQRLEAARGEPLWVVHRLDRDTSGVLLFARTADAHRRLNAAFESRAVKKTYDALVGGVPAERGRIEVPLHAARRGKTREGRPGEVGTQAACTSYERRELYDGAAWVSLEPATGRQHQLRVHARAAGWPILGDSFYAPPALRAAAPRLMLHASRLVLAQPTSGAPLTLESSLPSDFVAIRDALRRGALRLAAAAGESGSSP